jgi:hypothetical protein
MNTTEPKIRQPLRLGWGSVVLIGVVLICIWAVVAVTGMFRLSSEAAALQAAVLRDLDGSWHKKITLRAGFFATSAIRIGSKPFKLNPEACAAIESIRGAEVAIYNLESESRRADYASILIHADKVMSARSWERIAGVSKDGKLVAIFAPRAASGTSLRVCVLVVDGPNLVIAAGKAEMKPLFELAMKRVTKSRAGSQSYSASARDALAF